MRKGGGNFLYLSFFALISCCAPRVYVDGSFTYRRVIIAEAGKKPTIEVNEKGEGDYTLFLVYSKGLLGERLRIKMERKDHTFRAELPAGERGDVFFFWIEIYKGEELVKTIPELNEMRKEFKRNKPLSEILGRVEFK